MITQEDGLSPKTEAAEALQALVAIVTENSALGGRCSSCRAFGLLFPDGERRCPEHVTDADDALLNELDERARPLGLPRDAIESGFRWPYGPNVDVPARARMLDWAEANALTYVDRSHRCVSWVRTGHCRSMACRTAPPPDWMDHVTLWRRDGRPAVLVAQPYQLGPRDGAQLAQLRADAALRVELDEDAWYGRGLWMVGVWRSEA